MVERTIENVLRQGTEILKNSGVQTPILDSQLILSKVLGVDKLYIMTHYNQPISQDIENIFWDGISKRSKGMPVQHIIGFQEFMSLEFEVNQFVLIPRPDTEILVEQVINNIDLSHKYNILDIGTGSGCISISLAKKIYNAYIYSTDISNDAINVAKRNAQRNGVKEKINFYIGDMFEPFRHNNIKFDIIISNPPYIPSTQIQSLETNVKQFEPKIALDGGTDGLDFYRKIIKQSKQYLKKEGMVFLEIAYNQAEDVTKLFKMNDFDDIIIKQDLGGHSRVIQARL